MKAVLLGVIGLLALAMVASTQAGWDDWRVGGTGDYVDFKAPLPLTPVAGVTTLHGFAGNNKTVPQMGSENTPIVTDGEGDGMPLWTFLPNEPGSDIGNVWLTADDGYRFSIRMRLHDEPPSYTPPGSEFVYSVRFQHTASTVNYRADAMLSGGTYLMRLNVETTSANVFCLLSIPIEGGFAPVPEGGGIFTYTLHYSDLRIATRPAGCGPYTFGPGAAAGQTLDSFRGIAANSLGSNNVNTWAIGDESNGVSAVYTLGPISTGVPVGPWMVNLTAINGISEKVFLGGAVTGSCAGCAGNEWKFNVNVDKFLTLGCRYRFIAEYGNQDDVLVLKGAYCGWAEGLPIVVANLPPPPFDGRLPPYPAPRVTIGGDGLGTSDDSELDGYADDADPCAFNRNPDLEDTDGDGIGDACDPDLDNDGIPNGHDNCVFTPNADQRDIDGNGVGDACEDDTDGDGIPDDGDNCPSVSNFLQLDLDLDGMGDACDDDIDGDGITNRPGAVPQDAFPRDPTEWSDLDGDGIGDNSDPDMDGDGYSNALELASGSDPRDPKSVPSEKSRVANQVAGESASVGSLASALMILGLLLLGVLLVFVLRPKS
jgi:hypothetical protein